ncbi:hypothetical protein ACA910_016321 [Epithemia clementina (nom. ined.)]
MCAMMKELTTDELSSLATGRIEDYTNAMEERAKANQVFTDDELDNIIHSLLHLTPARRTSNNNKVDDGEKIQIKNNDYEEWSRNLRKILKEVAHISHKDWTVTATNAQKLVPFLIAEGEISNDNKVNNGKGKDDGFPGLQSASRYHRILTEGNWYGAVKHRREFIESKDEQEDAPCWAVLVTGVNGIRKTTSIHQPWFASLLDEALVPPSTFSTIKIPIDNLPTGENAFFRQLDHMIATLCNKDFAVLYALMEQRLKAPGGDDRSDGHVPPSPHDIQAYSNLKAAMFTRFRTLSELLGVLLLQQAQKIPINCLLETSGRDVAMFHYVDQIFPSSSYRKLVLHFVINDLSQAQASVDQRMVKEILAGVQAIQPSAATVATSDGSTAGDDTHANDRNSKKPTAVDFARVVHANAGGPYGSDVLPGVQEASDAVWKTVVDESAGVGDDWFKATIQINAHESKPWTAQAIKPDGSKGTLYTFV